MKISLPLKLGIAVVVFFALVFGALFAYRPVRQAWLVSRLRSNDPAVSEGAAKRLAAEGVKIIPLLKNWLESENPAHAKNACRVTAKITGDEWKELTGQLNAVLDGKPSKLTDAASAVFFAHNKVRWKVTEVFEDSPARNRNILCYLLTYYHSSEETEEDDEEAGVI
ncbi:MAG: hypothetical protein E3J72_00215 [Planctomycetota bacterium]|nr:MAG: hypothetical protein E3J72_00215 [Planctomycetota bacterium]